MSPTCPTCEFKNIQLVKEHVAEFTYSPTNCKKTYRVIVLWKDLRVKSGQLHLFDDVNCFFYITNDWEIPAEEIVLKANAATRRTTSSSSRAACRP